MKQAKYIFSSLLLALLLPFPFMANGAEAVSDPGFTLGLDGQRTITEFILPVGKSQIIQSRTPLAQIIVGDPNIADVELLNQDQFLVLGKSPGTTNLAFRDTQSRIIAVLDVVVGFDLVATKAKLNEMLPEVTGLEVRSANGKIMLSGQVSSATALDTVLAVSGSFTREDVTINLVEVGGGQQVLLEARIAEVKRSRVRDLGVQAEFSDGLGSETGFNLLTGTALQGAFGNGLTITGTSLGDELMLNLRALEREGSAHVLAEPNIVALSGQEASFLVGGEFPVPTTQAGVSAGAVTVSYKEFGVGLKFTPTVLSSKRINLRLNTEVSDLDLTSGTAVLGTTVPGLRTRRASTTIELGDGRSFAIAGLLQNDINSVVQKFPGLGNIPVIGALFRSTEFNRQETELVIVTTPRLVQSADRGDLTLPTADYAAPNRRDQYGMGRTEAPAADGTATPASQTPAEGLEGAQGHQF